jgi:DNA polymerase III subunit gamma/tau
MSYQVLARKWRPRNFSEMVGQEHVLRALINALDNDRLHHAFLFTGTRGVGKTTIARILAKSLNCEKGVSSTPCGQCSACTEIDEGRFIDLIEVDAASRTKVDETRELLENVQYTPSRGRYKVYLIDEVHMFSNHSFNALLKTLEEPPPHVKFLLATTDPQKLPVTILSRCLQFNLKRLPLALIAQHLGRILTDEGITQEPAALTLLARGADGSVRDALSLLDQAIAFGSGKVLADDVRSMLGTIEQTHIHDLITALADGDAAAVLARIEQLAEFTPDFAGVLGELLATLQRVAVAQAVPDAFDDSYGDREQILLHAQRIAAEDLQLFYQIGLIGRRDLPLAPDPRGGFEMIMLRMLAFRPAAAGAVMVSPAAGRPAAASVKPAAPRAAARPPEAGAVAPQSTVAAVPAAPQAKAVAAPVPTQNDWAAIVAILNLRGIAQQLAANCALQKRDADAIHLTLDAAHSQLHSKQQEERLQQALQEHFGKPLRLVLQVGAPDNETPAQRAAREAAERQQAAQQAIEQDPGVRALQDAFNARIQPDTVRPVD